MTRKPWQSLLRPVTDQAFAEAIDRIQKVMEERDAANPNLTPEPPTEPKPRVHKPGSLIAAEEEVWRWELIVRLMPVVCGGIEKCKLGRCRRSRCCAELEEMKPLIEEARATLARELAQWQAQGG